MKILDRRSGMTISAVSKERIGTKAWKSVSTRSKEGRRSSADLVGEEHQTPADQVAASISRLNKKRTSLEVEQTDGLQLGKRKGK